MSFAFRRRCEAEFQGIGTILARWLKGSKRRCIRGCRVIPRMMITRIRMPRSIETSQRACAAPKRYRSLSRQTRQRHSRLIVILAARQHCPHMKRITSTFHQVPFGHSVLRAPVTTHAKIADQLRMWRAAGSVIPIHCCCQSNSSGCLPS